MEIVTKTVSSMRCCKSVHASRRLRWAILAWMLGAAIAARADARADLTTLRVERTDEGLFLSAQVRFDLTSAVQDALLKGIPVHFVADVSVMRERWYWYDQEVASAQRYMRVAYQPLTRRWRLNTSAEPLVNAGLGVSLTQHYDSLAETMAAVQRLQRWKIANPSELESGGRQMLNFRFRLDSTQLPRTFQIGAVGQSDWHLSVERRIDLTQEASR
ncbi:DUF4390 domain-containing protein [Ottowia sp.]|uniref:DUF4390 domain-containing protein n=1 Tax=Ottowia sp. TaxID=1898956 RepID=UPI002600DE81|nr:DUF4390 domain-containing protein [Ottowia sp.]